MIAHSDDDYPYPPEPPDDTPTPSETPGTDIIAQLMITYPADSDGVVPPPKPVVNKPIMFQLQGEGSLSSNYGTTDPNGYCVVSFLPTVAGTDLITAIFQPDPNDPNTVYTDTCTVNVIHDENNGTEATPTVGPTSTPAPVEPVLIWKEDFESYAPESWPNNWIPLGQAQWDRANNCIVSYGGNQTLQLYPTYDSVSSAYRDFITPPCEISYSIRITNDNLDSIFSSSNAGIGIKSSTSYKPLLEFSSYMEYVNEDPNNVTMVNRRSISVFNYGKTGEYIPDTWYRITVRFYNDGRITYWLNGGIIAVTYNDPPSSYPDYFHFIYFYARQCNVWIDDIEVFYAFPDLKLKDKSK